MRVVILGSGPANPIIDRNGKSRRTNSSIVIKHKGKRLLVDCGKNFLEQADRESIKRIDALFITCGHQDNITGLGSQLDGWLKKNKQETVTIYSEAQTEKQIKEKIASKYHKNLKFVRTKLYNKYVVLGDITAIPARVTHSVQPGFPTVALNFSQADDKFTYASDVNTWGKETEKYLKNLDVLFWDGAGWDRRFFGHRAILEDLSMLDALKNKKVIFTQIGRDVPNHEGAEKIISQKVKEGKLKTDFSLGFDGRVVDVFRIKDKNPKDLISPDLPGFIRPGYAGLPKEEIDVDALINRLTKLPIDDAKIELAKLSTEELWALYNKLKG